MEKEKRASVKRIYRKTKKKNEGKRKGKQKANH